MEMSKIIIIMMNNTSDDIVADRNQLGKLKFCHQSGLIYLSESLEIVFVFWKGSYRIIQVVVILVISSWWWPVFLPKLL